MKKEYKKKSMLLITDYRPRQDSPDQSQLISEHALTYLT